MSYDLLSVIEIEWEGGQKQTLINPSWGWPVPQGEVGSQEIGEVEEGGIYIVTRLPCVWAKGWWEPGNQYRYRVLEAHELTEKGLPNHQVLEGV